MDWNAEWIWHPPTGNPDNFYLYARREFELDCVPAKAPLHVTAGALYKVYVNGTYVGRGPNPADPDRYYFDTYEVAEHLREGTNVVAAIAYCYGPEAHGVLNQNWGRGGFLLELRSGDGAPLVKTDDSWRVLQSPAWKQDVPVNCTLYGDFKEVYDSREEPEGWREAGFDDGEWLRPEVLGLPPVEPWSRLIPREIPFLTGERRRPVRVTWESASVTYSWREDYEVYNEDHLTEQGGEHGWPEEPVRVRKTHDDFAPSIICDFGEDVTGYPQITVADSDGGGVDVLYGEDLYLVRVDRFILDSGRQVLRPFNRRTFRYCKLLFPQTPDEIRLEDVTIELSTYPVEHRGAFRCSDDLLNRIWRVGRYTMRMSMLDHFVDCPWRERTLYGGDMWAENLIAHYAFGDPRLNAKSLRQMAHLQFEEGALPPWGPYAGCRNFYPSWSAFWGLDVLDHWELTGDRELLDELWPNLRKLLDWTLGEIDNSENLIGRPAKGVARQTGDPFRDWMEAEKEVFRPWDSVPFCALLRRAAAVADDAGLDGDAGAYADGADRMTGAIRERFIDAETGLCRARGSGRPGQYNTGLALWAGVQDGRQGLEATRRMFDPGVASVGAPFGGLFIIEGLFRYGADRRAVDFIREYWGGMLERGATTFWDDFSLDWPPGAMPARGTSLCHGWAAGPTYSLPARVLGVRPLQPGFEKILVEPHPADLDWASGSVPTPRGPVGVDWTRDERGFRVRLEAPPETAVRVSLPEAVNRTVQVLVDGEEAEPERDGARRVVEVGPGEHVVTAYHRR